MATKRYYATGSFRYGTRMLTAGDPVDLDAPKARLYTALGKISPNRPRATKVETAVTPATAPAAETPAPKKAAARKRKVKAKK